MLVARTEHKHYILTSQQDIKEAVNLGYAIYSFNKKELLQSWENSNSLRFINTWQDKQIVPQFSTVTQARKLLKDF